eukprot:scaffold2596_cov194-Alexandrium_tamarense.AAC.2
MMIRNLVDVSRKSYTRMAGGCPCFGSGGNNCTRTASTTATKHTAIPRKGNWNTEEEEKHFRDGHRYVLKHCRGNAVH